MAPAKAKRGRGGSSQVPGERESKGRKISSTSSTRTLNPSPPSVTRRALPPQFSDLTPPPQKVQTPSHSSHSNRKGVHQRRSNNLIPEESLVTPQRSKVPSQPENQGGPHIDRVVEDQQYPLQHHGMEDDEVADDADNTDDADDAGDDDADDADDDGAHQEPSCHLSLQALLSTEGRSDFLETLSPIEGQGLW